MTSPSTHSARTSGGHQSTNCRSVSRTPGTGWPFSRSANSHNASASVGSDGLGGANQQRRHQHHGDPIVPTSTAQTQKPRVCTRGSDSDTMFAQIVTAVVVHTWFCDHPPWLSTVPWATINWPLTYAADMPSLASGSVAATVHRPVAGSYALTVFW